MISKKPILQLRLNGNVMPIFGKTHFVAKLCPDWVFETGLEGIWISHPVERTFFVPWHAVSWIEYEYAAKEEPTAKPVEKVDDGPIKKRRRKRTAAVELQG